MAPARGAERAWRGNGGLRCSGDWALAALGGGSPPGAAPAPSWLLTSVFPGFPPAQPSALLFSPRGSRRSGSTGAVPAPLYKAPAGPFGKRISFFLDAFPDLGVMEGLRAARAPAGLREEEPGSLGPQPHAPGTKAPLLEPWPQGPLGQAHSLRLGPSECFLLLPQIRSEKVSSRRGRARGGGR